MLIIGIDPGTARTGFGIISEDQSGDLTALAFGVIETPKVDSDEHRLQTIYKEINKLLDLHRPEKAAVEKLFFQKNVTNAISVGQARGVILLALANQKIPIYEFTPNEVKLAVTGYGGAKKNQVQIMVMELLKLKEIPNQDDAADALAIAICQAHSTGIERLITSGGGS
jgi:crossover junction endodeoxyribonuclease RuvC